MKAFKVKKYLISPSGEVYGYMNTNIVDVAEMIVLEHDWMDEYGYSDMLIIDFLVERKKFVHYTVYSQWCCHSKGLTGKQQRKMSKLSGGL